jgi:hypothetical protein
LTEPWTHGVRGVRRWRLEMMAQSVIFVCGRAGRHQGLQPPTPAAVLSTNDKNTADDYSVGLPALSQFPEPRMNALKSGLQYVGVDSRQLMTIIGPA